MKYLEALKAAGKQQTPSIPENKMQPGTRLDQNDPQSLVSSLRGTPKDNDAAIAKLSQELGIDLATVKGTGPSGHVTERDVRKAKAKKDQDAKTDEKLGLGDK